MKARPLSHGWFPVGFIGFIGFTGSASSRTACTGALLGALLCALSLCAVWAQGKGQNLGQNLSPLPVSTEAVTFFETKIRPLLVEKCFACHGESVQKGGLRLNTRAGLLTGGMGGAVVVAGKPDESALIKAVHYEGALKMPPSGKLTSAQIDDLTAWVKMGAVWPEARAEDRPVVQPLKPDSLAPYSAEKRHFWSFQAIKNPALPAVKNGAWCRNPIDRFVLARLEARGLKPAPAADRHTLLRRVTFDLTGLPPTPDEIDAFVKDKSSNAWEKVVDRLLASPRYGEQWGRHWLDVVRYADSSDARGVGSEGDISEAWRYRDWVVSAFNRDLPYNQFIKYQIAGDLLPAKEGKGKREKGKEKEAVSSVSPDVNVEGTIATGMLAIGNWGNGDADKDKILTDIADDQVDVVSRGMMGLTVACARCHDHKFDPILTKDYYGLAGIFFSTHILPKLTPKGAGENILRIPLVTRADAAKRAEYQQQVASVEKQLAQERRAQVAANALNMRPQTGAYVQAAWQYEHRPAAQSGVTLDAFAQGKGLQAWALRQWRDYLGLGDYPLMMQATADASGMKGLSSWRGKADCPNLLVNSNDTPRTISTLTLPPRSVAVHPGPANGVVVAWRSPVSGVVRITGRVADADPNGGDGIAWAIDQRGANGPRELASGDFPNGGAQDFMQGKNANSLQSVTVRQNERIEFVVLPKQNYGFDTTVLDVNIAEVGTNSPVTETKDKENKDKSGRVWNLTRDIVDDPLQGGKGNPHTDRYGNAGVWAFEDMADRQRALPTGGPQNSVLAQWRQAAASAGEAGTADETVRQASEAFGRAFTAADEKSPFWINSAADEMALPAASQETLTKLAAQLDALKKSAPLPIAYANGAQEGGVPESPHAGVHDVRVHIRGSYARLGDVAPRHFPIVLAGDRQTPITQGSGRLQLAEWLASDRHPLTPRVWVNRVWQRHFGQGIVRTPSNFGYLGERPTHPELLDWLAYQFKEGKEADSTQNPESKIQNPYACGWSTKKLHRLILMSATYQQASEARTETYKADPDNRLWGRMNRQRLESEAIRDNLLSAAGRLDTTMGGVGYRDFAMPRRTLYYMTIRSDRTGFGPLFDVADSTASVEKRTVSTVAPQSLYLLNNPFVLEQTRSLAERLKKEMPDGPDSDIGRIRRAYVLLYGRPVTPAEIAIGTAYLQRARAGAKEGPAWEAYCQLLLCANEFVYVD
jgi:Protein of unknown function (DUF1549)/Protein of unknown function (DUF1553)/Planctomycete cytochrome C